MPDDPGSKLCSMVSSVFFVQKNQTLTLTSMYFHNNRVSLTICNINLYAICQDNSMINLTQGLPALRSTDLGLEGKIALIMKIKYSLGISI